MRDPIARLPEASELWGDLQMLRSQRSEFGEVADTLVALAADETVSVDVFDQVCRAVFIVLEAWLEEAKRA